MDRRPAQRHPRRGDPSRLREFGGRGRRGEHSRAGREGHCDSHHQGFRACRVEGPCARSQKASRHHRTAPFRRGLQNNDMIFAR